MQTRDILHLLEESLAALAPGPILVAFSGGLDSTALLHALAQCRSARERGLRAVHVDHGIHNDSAQWARHCQAFASALGIELLVRRVEVPRRSDLGLEASARRARYGEIAALLVTGEILALAHHRDDQTETVLLKLLRGAGPEGMGAMRPLRRLGNGWAWRPLLNLPRAALREYAIGHGLHWLSDPSNEDPGIDRNYLRLQVLPRILARWPEAGASIAQSSNWAREVSSFVDAEASRALERVRGLDPATLRFRDWLDLPAALRDPVMRQWLRAIDLAEPTHFQAAELLRQIREAGEDRQPCVRWPGVEVRRYRDLLFAMRPVQYPPPDWHAPFDGRELQLPLDLGVLRLAAPGRDVRLPQSLYVRFRRGGETLRLSGNGPNRELRDLLQESGVPPWQRARLPLLFDADDRLLAVAGLYLAADASALLEPLGAQIEWHAPARAHASRRSASVELADGLG